MGERQQGGRTTGWSGDSLRIRGDWADQFASLLACYNEAMALEETLAFNIVHQYEKNHPCMRVGEPKFSNYSPLVIYFYMGRISIYVLPTP